MTPSPREHQHISSSQSKDTMDNDNMFILSAPISSVASLQSFGDESVGGFSTEKSYLENQNKVVVITTPYSTGVNLAHEISRKGFKLICLWNRGITDEMKGHVPQSCADLRYLAELDEAETLEETERLVRDAAQEREIVAVICGGEAGVDIADALSERMGLLSNGTAIANRRDKKCQQELIRAAGLRATRQAGGSEWSDVQDFLLQEQYPVIVKPNDSAGSDGVKLCHSFEEAKEHFFYLRNSHDSMVHGGACANVLCQEYLKGKEYVVDHVSLNGVHKTTMIWLYDKRPANGASFVYFGEYAVDVQSPEVQLLIPYARQVLDALGIQHGPSHGEFILTEDGPCLVEMNCRCQGGQGSWQPIAQGMTGGYDQVTASAQCYLEPERFEELPSLPPSPFLASGQIVDLVSYVEGTIKDTPGFRRIERLPSFISMETPCHPGSKVYKTIDLVTDAGSVILMHHDPKVLQDDVNYIRALEEHNALFELEEESSKPWPAALERKFSVPKDPEPIVYADAMPQSMYLERKFSLPKEPTDMYMER